MDIFRVLLCFFILAGSAFAAEISGTIVSIRDGDSVEILDDLDKVSFRVDSKISTRRRRSSRFMPLQKRNFRISVIKSM